MRARTERVVRWGHSTALLVGVVLAVIGVLLVVPVSVGAKGTQRVILVGPGGQALKIVGGRLGVGDGTGALTVNGTVHSVVTAPGRRYGSSVTSRRARTSTSSRRSPPAPT